MLWGMSARTPVMRADKEKLSLEIKSQKFSTSCLRLFATAEGSARRSGKFVSLGRKFRERINEELYPRLLKIISFQWADVICKKEYLTNNIDPIAGEILISLKQRYRSSCNVYSVFIRVFAMRLLTLHFAGNKDSGSLVAISRRVGKNKKDARNI